MGSKESKFEGKNIVDKDLNYLAISLDDTCINQYVSQVYFFMRCLKDAQYFENHWAVCLQVVDKYYLVDYCVNGFNIGVYDTKFTAASNMFGDGDHVTWYKFKNEKRRLFGDVYAFLKHKKSKYEDAYDPILRNSHTFTISLVKYMNPDACNELENYCLQTQTPSSAIAYLHKYDHGIITIKPHQPQQQQLNNTNNNTTGETDTKKSDQK